MATRIRFQSLPKKVNTILQTLINPSSKTLIPISHNGYFFKVPTFFNTLKNQSDNDYESDLNSSNNGGILSKRVYTAEEKEAAANQIGYKVIGPLQRPDPVFKPYDPLLAVLQLILNKVFMLGSSAQTIIGRPILPDAAVHAVVEEHALDAKVIIFKKKRRKNYRRTKGHRQELTKLRITDIQGIEKPEITASGDDKKVANKKKPEKVEVSAYKKPEKVTVPA